MQNFIKTRIELEQRHFPQGVTPDMIRLLDDVQELLERAFESGKAYAERTAPQPWSNQSAFGYTILAAERVGLKDVDTQRLVRSLHRIFDEVSLDESARRYINSPY